MPKLGFTWVGLAAGAAYWLLESVLHAYVFDPELSLAETLSGEHDFNELIMRLIIIFLLAGFGFVAEMLIQRQRKMQARTDRLNSLLQFLSEINQKAQRKANTKDMFEAACKAAVEIAGFRVAWIGMQQDGELKLAEWAVAESSLEDVTRRMEPPRLGECLGAQCVLNKGKETLCELRDRVDCHVPWLPSALEHGCEHAMAMPLKMGGKTVGVFEVYAGKEGRIDENEQSILNEAAEDISVALTNIEHEAVRRADEEKLHARLEELERFQKATVQREFRIKELRDEIRQLQGEVKGSNK